MAVVVWSTRQSVFRPVDKAHAFWETSDVDRKDQLRELKLDLAAAIDRARRNGEDLHAIERALQANLEKLRELRAKQTDNRGGTSK